MLLASPPAAARPLRAVAAQRQPRCPAASWTALQPAPQRRSGVCFSSRQSAKRKLSQYGPDDPVPNAPTTGPLPLREADALGEFSGLDAAESRAFALLLAGAANDTKAVDISVLDVSRVVSWTRFFVIATCFSRPQVDAAMSRMTAAAEAPPYARVLAHTPAIGSWVCMDYGDVVAHVFTPLDRNYYDLSGYYAKATPVELPFVSQKGA